MKLHALGFFSKYCVISLYYAQLFPQGLSGQYSVSSGVIVCINAFGLGNMHFMKTVSDFVPVFTLGKRGNSNTSFLGNLLGKGV